MATPQDKPSQSSPAPADSTHEVSGTPHQESTPKKKSGVIFGIVGVVALVVIVLATRFVMWSQHHVATDDSQITATIADISPQVNGTVLKVAAEDNQIVKQGDLLVQLDDTDYKIAVDNAKANLALAIAQAKGATASVLLTGDTGNAQVLQAQGGIGQAEGGISTAITDVNRTAASVAASKAQAAGAEASVLAARSGYLQSDTARERAEDGVRTAQAQLDSARSAVQTAQANLAAAQATADNAQRDARRIEALFQEGATSGQSADHARAAAKVATAQVDAARQQVNSAQSVVVERQSELRAARSQVATAKAAIAQSLAQITAAKAQASAAHQAVQQSLALEQGAAASVNVAKAKVQQAEGQLKAAKTVNTQVAVSQSARTQAEARIEQARAQLKAAEVNLARTRIVAPIAGRVSRKTVQVGNLVAAGTPMMAIVADDAPWVIANFKETQLGDVHVGQEAEIEVDAYPGKTFKGKVQSLSAGTGATFALLPPDNATGNFTKVVQRVPVKITIDAGQPGLDTLRSGMSVNATITTH